MIDYLLKVEKNEDDDKEFKGKSADQILQSQFSLAITEAQLLANSLIKANTANQE